MIQAVRTFARDVANEMKTRTGIQSSPVISEPLPPTEWFKEIEDRQRYTPDGHLNDSREFMLLFVYDRKMEKMNENSLIADSSLPNRGKLATAFTSKSFYMVTKQLGQFKYPIALEMKPSMTTRIAKIKGELWKVRPDRYLELDKHMENKVFFKRRRIQITVPCYISVNRVPGASVNNNAARLLGGTKRGPYAPSVEAWTYIGDPDYWVPQLDGGYIFKRCPIFTAKNPQTWVQEYTQFTDQ